MNLSDERTDGGIYALMNRRLIPYAVNLELTKRCNLHCVHCYCTGGSSHEMPFDTIIRLLDDLAALGTMELTLTGGEPLLRPDFIDILQHAIERRGFSVKIFSNLTLLDEGLADTIAAFPVNRIEVTLLGPDASTHDCLTGVEGSFDASVRAVGFLRERNIRVAGKTVVMKSNVMHLPALYRLADELSIPFRHDATLFVRDDGGRAPLGLALSGHTLKRYRRHIPYAGCNAGRSVMSIDADGTVRPCGPFPLSTGNCMSQPIGDIWANSSVMNRVRRLSRKHYRACHGCEYEIYCNGCVAMGMGLASGRVISCNVSRHLTGSGT